ncbi:hypothetical protein COLO4_30166 [Corchorus olitorius]|uniref:Uncharacterized protein n=1 Tax=Corchorus olitorius TaxID=93759 RepID=A0A1R3HAM5_9ROSI|nr:hypothetical protein COLO4_30166 [Corchorus olitorius]
MSGTDFSDNNSGSRISTTTSFQNQAKESSSNSSNISSYTTTAAGFQMNNNNSNMVENGGFSWDADSMFHDQFQHQVNNGIIKSEELKPTCSWQEAAASGQLHNHNSVDFSSYPLTSLSEDLTGANFDVFHQI